MSNTGWCSYEVDVIGEKEHTCNILTDYRGLLLHVRMYIFQMCSDDNGIELILQY